MNAIQGALRIAQKLLRATPHGVTERRSPPSRLRRPATEPPTKSDSAHVARRYAKTEAGRAIAAVITVAAVVILAGLAWLWVFGN